MIVKKSIFWDGLRKSLFDILQSNAIGRRSRNNFWNNASFNHKKNHIKLKLQALQDTNHMQLRLRNQPNMSLLSLSERYMNHGSVSWRHPTMHCLSFILFHCLFLPLSSSIGYWDNSRPVIWCSCVVQTAAVASRLLLCSWLLLYAGWGTELNAARHIQLQSPQPINPQVFCSLPYPRAGRCVIQIELYCILPHISKKNTFLHEETHCSKDSIHPEQLKWVKLCYPQLIEPERKRLLDQRGIREGTSDALYLRSSCWPQVSDQLEAGHLAGRSLLVCEPCSGLHASVCGHSVEVSHHNKGGGWEQPRANTKLKEKKRWQWRKLTQARHMPSEQLCLGLTDLIVWPFQTSDPQVKQVGAFWMSDGTFKQSDHWWTLS